MKFNYKIATAVIGSFVLGLGAASVLHARAKPPAYVFAEVDVKDQDGYAKEFLPKVQANMKEFSGKFLGGGYNKAVSITGDAPKNRIVLVQFPDMDAAKAFSEKQKPIDEAGNKYINSRRVMAFEGVEPK
jgi:uncharacterized protein (DUF1330 family)